MTFEELLENIECGGYFHIEDIMDEIISLKASGMSHENILHYYSIIEEEGCKCAEVVYTDSDNQP